VIFAEKLVAALRVSTFNILSLGVLAVYLIARCNSRHETCSADIPNVVHFNIHSKFLSD